ncbi:hypothetical protein B0T17DRAFT_528431 [Bombardia bombarda]|uniref:SET domain-containing protein n=1 Tax=Bombardia bombarda TaxID=252184 RepID=A0AA39XAN3_9PEZI|nr:hypothetical protein B0T17DRAFT_528431 [Bombardia bombarda]
MKDADERRFQALTAWAQSNGANLHPSLEIYHDNVTKYSVRVKESVSDGLKPPFDAIACPLPTTISYANALIDGPIALSATEQPKSPAFPERFMNTLPPHVIGRFFFIQQYLKADNSYWQPYIATLPQPEHTDSWALPAFWPEENVDFLAGTNAYVAIVEIQANVKREFKQAINILREEDFPDWQDYNTQLLYNWAFCIFTSRSFRSSLVLSQPAQAQISQLLPPGCEMDDFSILQPLFDIPNHSMTSNYDWDVSSDPNCCQLICKDAYGAGDQVYNNYGLKTNSELLLAYGFILPRTEAVHNDYVHVRKRGQGGSSTSPASRPKDFLISLQPMSDPSSVVGKARQLSSNGPQLHTHPAFAHFEHALIYDLAFALSIDDEKRTIEQLMSNGQNKDDELPSSLDELLERIKQTLSAKLLYDYQELKHVGLAEDMEDLEDDELDQKQLLMVTYRRQCEKVLVAALRTIGVLGSPSENQAR